MTNTVDSDAFRRAHVECGGWCAGASDVGRVRTRNEDAYWISADASVLVVADGLGGLPAGDAASSSAAAAVAARCADGTGGAGYEVEALLREAAKEAQRAVLEAAGADPMLRGMATTLVVAALGGGRLSVLHVGDSRAMVWRDGHLRHTTFDHNPVGDLLKAGSLDSDAARWHPARHQVREVVGLPEGFDAEVQVWKVEPGDVVLLCTDGISDALSLTEIARILGVSPDPASAVVDLVHAAALAGGYDNATVVLRCVT